MLEDPDRCYQAACAKDARFDGWFTVAVTSTGIYCRPSCPARTPKRENVRFYPSSAAAQQAGFRACLRCRPEASPGSPEWNTRADSVARAMRLIRDGVVDREGVEGVARRLGYSVRQLNRLVTAAVGTGPLALARAQRGQAARVLLETTDLPVTHIAFAAGFASVRQCNDTVRQIFADTPTGLRRRAARSGSGRRPGATPALDGPGPLVRLRLPARRPCDPASALLFLGARALPGVESFDGTTYRRTLRLPHGHGVAAVSAEEDGGETGPVFVGLALSVSDQRDLGTAVSRVRQLLDLDADPVAVAEALGADRWLGPLVAADPGRRMTGSVDGFELAVRAVIGQQVSVAGAGTVAARLVRAAGEPLADHAGGSGGSGGSGSACGGETGGATLSHLFPTPDALVELAGRDPGAFSMPGARRRALVELARSVGNGAVAIDPGADPGELRASLTAIPGVGPWTAEYVAMRGLRDPDAFLPSDAGVLKGAARAGLEGGPARLAAVAERWRPWRSYAVAHLWAACAPRPRAADTPMATGSTRTTRKGRDAA